jgi:hypothetical protein
VTSLGPYPPLGADAPDRQVTRVVVITSSGVFEGDFRYHYGDRINDAIRTSEGYILLTDVQIQLTVNVTGATTISAPFILINTTHIDVIVPKDQSERARVRETG